MIPVLVFLAGLCAIVLCVWLLTKTGGALWKRKLGEALEEDRRNLSNEDKVG